MLYKQIPSGISLPEFRELILDCLRNGFELEVGHNNKNEVGLYVGVPEEVGEK